MNSPSPKIPVGLATVVGQAVAVLQFAATLLAFLTGDHTTKVQLAPELLTAATATQGIVLAGRYLQAHKALGQVVAVAREDAEVLGVLPSAAQEAAAPPPAGTV